MWSHGLPGASKLDFSNLLFHSGTFRRLVAPAVNHLLKLTVYICANLLSIIAQLYFVSVLKDG